MKKRGIFALSLALGIFILNFVSAYGSYGYFSILNFINTIDPLALLAFGSIFIIIFAFVRFGLGRSIFRDPYSNGATTSGSVVAAAITFLIMYYGIYKTNVSITGAFYGLGISSSILYPLFGIIFLIGFIFVMRKIGF